MGTSSQMTHLPCYQEHYGNCRLVPASKIYDLAWQCQNKYKVGKVICEAFRSDGTPIIAHPRTAAKRQIAKVDALGYKLYSAFEVEFCVFDAQSLKPIHEGKSYASELMLHKQSDWIFDVEQHLRKLYINVEAMHAEYGPGQFEFNMSPKCGIDVFDDMVLMKEAMKEIMSKYGVKPTFMTKPFPNNPGNGFHINHSLWDINDKNVFFDASKPFNISDTLRYWIGGILKHINALTVLCNPTPNCFRRLNKDRTPSAADWSIDNRLTTLRLKNDNPSHTYVENRLPSSACNPYIVAAATIAAGLDGIDNNIEPPEMGRRKEDPQLPSFEESINALKEDEALGKALGEEFVEWFIAMKQHEIVKLRATTVESQLEDELEMERKEYFDLI